MIAQPFSHLGTLICLGGTVRASWAQSRAVPGVETLSAAVALAAIDYPTDGTQADLADYFAKVGVGASIKWGELAVWTGLPPTAPRASVIDQLRQLLRRACDCSAPTQLAARVQVLGLLRAVEMREPTGLARATLILRGLLAALGIDVAPLEGKSGLNTAAAVAAIRKALGGDDQEFDAGQFADMLGISRTVGKAGVESKLRELAKSAATTLSAATVVLGIVTLSAGTKRSLPTGLAKAIAANQQEPLS